MIGYADSLSDFFSSDRFLSFFAFGMFRLTGEDELDGLSHRDIFPAQDTDPFMLCRELRGFPFFFPFRLPSTVQGAGVTRDILFTFLWLSLAITVTYHLLVRLKR